MLTLLNKLLDALDAAPDRKKTTPEAVHRLSAALLMQLVLVDDGEDERESSVVAEHITSQSTACLDQEELDQLLTEARSSAEQATSLYEFTAALNERCSDTEKQEILRDLWRVAYADGRLDKYEEHFIRRAADLLYIPHPVFIQIKHEVQPPA